MSFEFHAYLPSYTEIFV